MSTYGEPGKGDWVDVEDLLIDAQVGVRRLKKEVNKLERENARLCEKDRSATDDDTNLEELGVRDLEMESLKQRVSKLNKENIKLRKEIEDLRKSSLEEEVDELQTSVVSEELDPVYRMRKLLRRFSDLMLVSTISDDVKEECPICYVKLKPKESSALLCDHPICHDCVAKISRAATRDTEKLRCPQCRKDTPREELELIHMTETERWDKLTEVAQAWMEFDRRGDLDSSEEEDEENFITDGNGTSEATTEAEGNDIQTMDDAPAQGMFADVDQEEPEGPEQASPVPSSASGLSFSNSPSSLKRKRLENLAAERSQRTRTSTGVLSR